MIYFTLGEIEEKEKNIPQALNYYKMSVKTSTANPNQKALSYLRMGEINFDATHYEAAESYYDSAIVTLPKDHPNYENIVARKKTLSGLVTQIKTISREDSLQRIASMSEKERNRYIEDLIAFLDKEDARRQKEADAAKNAAQNSGSNMR